MNTIKYIRVKPEQKLIENMTDATAMTDDHWIDQKSDIYSPTPGQQAAEMADDLGIDYSYALVLCNCD